VGRKLGRTLYVGEVFVGLMETRELAAEVVETMNRVGRLPDEVQRETGRERSRPARCAAETRGLLAALIAGHVHRCSWPDSGRRHAHHCECGTEWTEIDPPDAQRRSEATPQNACPNCPGPGVPHQHMAITRTEFDRIQDQLLRVDPYDSTKGGVTGG
jgi:hypothetical protein